MSRYNYTKMSSRKAIMLYQTLSNCNEEKEKENKNVEKAVRQHQ